MYMYHDHETKIGNRGFSGRTKKTAPMESEHNLTDATTRNLRVGKRDYLKWCADNDVAPLDMTPELARDFLFTVARRRMATSPKPPLDIYYKFVHTRKRAVDLLFERAGRTSPYDEGAGLEAWKQILDPGVHALWLLGDAPPQELPGGPSPLLAKLEPEQNGSNSVERDVLLLRLTYYGQLAPGEVVALEVSDVRLQASEVIVEVRIGQNPRTVRITDEPAGLVRKALTSWLERLGAQSDGPLLRQISRADNISKRGLTSRIVGRVILRYGEERGLDRDQLTWRALVDSAFMPSEARNDRA